MIYADTSAVVAYYVPEELSEHVQRAFADEDEVFISELVEVEFVSAVSLRMRLGDISSDEARRAAGLFTAHADGGLYGKVGLTARHFRMARGYIGGFEAAIKAPDALHIAAAGERGLRLMAADGQLVRNARAFGVEAELVEA